MAMLLGFRQVVNDSLPHHVPGQRLPPAALLRLWRLRGVLLLAILQLRVFFFFLCRFRIAGLPERLEQRQLFFRQLLALAIALGVEKLA